MGKGMVDSSLKYHLINAKNNGITKEKFKEEIVSTIVKNSEEITKKVCEFSASVLLIFLVTEPNCRQFYCYLHFNSYIEGYKIEEHLLWRFHR